MPKNPSIGQYILQELHRRKVRHIFGVPGDYVLRFFSLIEDSPIQHVGTTREDCAGFAADAYARVNGFGAACVTYCVGGFSLTNPVGGAFAEKSPVIVISGAPGLRERERDPLLHHRVREFDTQRQMFDHITVASACLDDPLTAYREIDRVFHAVERYKRPGYLEIPRDMVDVSHAHQRRTKSIEELTDEDTLSECIAEAAQLINGSTKPVIVAGVEVHRFGLQDALVELVEATRIPVAATLLGKSVISEAHPLYLGIYEGAMGRAEVQKYVESADLVLMLGVFMTDINLGVYTADLDQSRTIYATSEKVSIKRHSFEDVPFRSFFGALLHVKLRRRKPPKLPGRKTAKRGARPTQKDPIRVQTLFDELDEFITDDTVVVSDVGDCLFGAADLTIHRRTEFISPAYYTSMGFSMPASIGAQLANPKLRPLVLVGDGAFQMTGLELSTTVRLGLNPIVVVLNNRGYSTERQIQDGPFNDVTEWRYSKTPELLGQGRGFVVKTLGDLRKALRASLANQDTFSILDVQLDPYDKSPAMARLAERLSKKV